MEVRQAQYENCTSTYFREIAPHALIFLCIARLRDRVSVLILDVCIFVSFHLTSNNPTKRDLTKEGIWKRKLQTDCELKQNFLSYL